MKRIILSDNKWQAIKNKHFKYCKTLKLANGTTIDKDICWKLCCENPFDFSVSNVENPLHKYFKPEYWKFIDEKIYDYSKQYKKFRIRPRDGWSGVALIQELGVNVCPYCGMNYFSTVTKLKTGKTVTVATLDHYRPREVYPMFAMNLYNLIPSCKNCNSTFKSIENEHIICNPYFYNLEEEITFRIKSEDVINQILTKNFDLKIFLDYDLTNEILTNHDKTLSLKERYNYFKDVAKTLIYKKRIYIDNYLKQLSKLGLDLSQKHLEDLIVKQDVFGENEPFLKFKQDIWKQLKEIC